MFSILRGGPKIVLLESAKIQHLKEYLTNEFNVKESSLNSALEESDESHTMICVVKQFRKVVNKEDIECAFAIKYESDKLLCKILSDHKCPLICNIRMAPRIIIMRAFGDIEKVIDEIKNDYNAITASFENIIESHNDEGTVITFVQNPLNRNMNLTDLYNKSLFVQDKYYSLLRSLRMHGLKYINQGLGNKDWYELEIRIYDIYDAYEIHYKRLLKVIESLELGVVLGESWGKDYPRPLMSVGVYRLKFLTFYPPEYIKRIFVGLEHLEDGTRIFDCDIYYRRKKLYWVDLAKKEFKGQGGFKIRKFPREDYGMLLRTEVLSKIGETEREEIFRLEDEILKSRY